MSSRLAIWWILPVLLACGGDSDPLGDMDAGNADAGTDATIAPLFAMSGDCGELDVELTSASPAAFENRMLFAREYGDADLVALSDGGQEMVSDGNLNDGSLLSEVFAFESLASCENATLIKTEAEIIYDVDGKKTDLSVTIGPEVIGVSVVRAQTFPLGTDMTVPDARARLEDKLSDILESSANVSPADAWTKQILAVVVYNQQHGDALATALPMIDAGIRADTIVWLTITDGPDDPIYE